jgi:ADP-heptose:LPS heptosyltransferase
LTDLALIINQLDMVIGVDSASIHLAAALGKPTWVLLGTVAEWYWPAISTTSDWYPAMRIFRQLTPKDSGKLQSELDTALAQWLLEYSPAKTARITKS